jgi:hypothetical protein
VTDDIANSLIGFLNDYTTDRRGDIGSLVRLEGIQAARVVIQMEAGVASQSYIKNVVGCLCRLAAEKLDRVRLEAWLCLQIFWESAHDFPPLQRYEFQCPASRIYTDYCRPYEHFSQVSSPDYFLQLLGLQAVDWLRLPLLQGLATSAVAGSEGLIRSARSALVQNINTLAAEQRSETVTSILQDFQLILNEKLPDDRYAIPILELSAFLLDGYIASAPGFWDPRLVSQARFHDKYCTDLVQSKKVVCRYPEGAFQDGEYCQA